MRTSSVVLAAGIAAGLTALPTQADASTHHPKPGRHELAPDRHAAPRPWLEDPDQADVWSEPDPMAPVARRFAPRLDSPVPGDEEQGDEEQVPDSPALRPGGDRPARHHPRPRRHPRARSPIGERHRGDRVPEDPWPLAGAVSICVDVDVVAIVDVDVRVGCDCAPPPHHVRPPSPPRPSPPRTRPPVAERPRPPARPPARPPTPPKAPSATPQVHRAMTPRAAAPPRRKNPLATLMVLVVLTVVISAGAGIAFAR